MPATFLLKDNRRLSDAELSVARSICREAVASVRKRPRYIRWRRIDPRFALPDANWSYEAPNEFVQLFRRVAQGDRQTLSHLRGLAPVFSGYHLYEVCDAKGVAAAQIELDENLDRRIEERLNERNPLHVTEWRQLTHGIPRRFLVAPARMLGEVGHDVDGVIVNNDTCTYQERVNLLYRSGLADWLDRRIEEKGEIRICEIGGGYGALASWFKQAFPEVSYTIVDLPESLLFSRLYLSLTRPDVRTSAGLTPAPRGFRFVPNYTAERLTESFDLVINTLSMSEMSEFQVRRYVQLMKCSWLAEGGLFFEQNQDNRFLGLTCAEQLFASEFPEHLFLETDGWKLRNGSPNVWSMRPIDLEPRAYERGEYGSVELLEDLGGFNLVRSSVYWGFRKELGPIDPATLEFRDEPPHIFVGTSAREIKAKVAGLAAIDEERPCEREAGCPNSSPDVEPCPV
jgi:hypothetical protein